MLFSFYFFFFFKQKTAYEMRISDWSSDVCSSDLARRVAQPRHDGEQAGEGAGGGIGRAVDHGGQTTESRRRRPARPESRGRRPFGLINRAQTILLEIGRESCRERVCQYV